MIKDFEPTKTVCKLKAKYQIHTGWGDHIEWLDTKQFRDANEKTIIDVYGHLPDLPKVGDTLLGEFTMSWKLYKFVEVEYKSDPPDMFFGKAKFLKQEAK